MGNEYKYTVELKQETPMIHFQYDQNGACLRASEVKPKLDKFIIKKNSNIPDNWYIDKSKKSALNYKMKIIVKGTPQKSDTLNLFLEKKKHNDNKDKTINSMYFGNMAKSEVEAIKNYKETVFYNHNKIELDIICFIPELMCEIKKYLPEFFAVNNFGTRQSKGFGGFSILKGKDVSSELNKNNYEYFYVNTKIENYSINLDIVDAIYAFIKGGKNFSKINPNAYIKGYIQRQYLDDINKTNMGSDKAFIKAKGFFDNNENNYDDYSFVRALLGLAEKYEFKDDKRKGTITIKCADGSVVRYKSPITVKIVDSYIFFIFENTFDQIRSKRFVFSRDDIKHEIKVPDSFDIDDFITKFIEYFNKQKNIYNEFNNKNYKVVARDDFKLVKGGK